MQPTQPVHRRCTKQLCEAPRTGLTLIELLLTIAVLGILAAVLLPQLSGDLPERLSAAAQVVSTDLDYARSLAVANNTTYRITFDPPNNRYYLRHSGDAAQYNTLPHSTFRQANDPVDQQTTNLSQLPLPEPGVQLLTVVQMQGSGQPTNEAVFNERGGTESLQQTVLWLSCGRGNVRRYISVVVDPVTGLVTIGPVASALPTAVRTIVQGQAVEAGI
jgi:prepilin-type N-terminal cleavage/methylation domain-containing protein